LSATQASIGVADCLAQLGGEACTYMGVVERRINSRIHKALWGVKPIAIKECFDETRQRPDPATAEREFAALTSLANLSPASGEPALAPLPLALCRERAVYAMTWSAGRPMTGVILTSATDAEHAGRLGAAAGRWLRRLHALHPLPPRRGDFEERISYVQGIRAENGGRDSLIQRATEALLGLATIAAAPAIPASWIHGDMKSDNLLVDGELITGLDVHLRHENTVVYDLAPFLNHLSLLRWTPRGLWQRKKLARVADQFLSAYAPDAAGWTASVAWLRSYLLVQMAVPSGHEGALQRLFQRRTIRSELARAVGDLERCR
jgi:aminoglycoside phosphotransferase (APT) family kinase protein